MGVSAESEQIADLAERLHRHFEISHIASVLADAMGNALACESNLAAIVRALDRLARHLVRALFGAPIECRERMVDDAS